MLHVQILTVAVLAVIMTAPLGAVATSLLGPVLLTKASPDGSVEEGGDGGSQPPDEDDSQDVLSAARGAGALPIEPDLHGRKQSYNGMYSSLGMYHIGGYSSAISFP